MTKKQMVETERRKEIRLRAVIQDLMERNRTLAMIATELTERIEELEKGRQNDNDTGNKK